MRCHYEVLEVARDASADDIKKAYKKLALRWHPDKNIGNEEEATERFKEISQAFNVLSDPQERQWYDDHRDDILRGGDGTGGTDEVIINIWPYFSSTCFDGFEGPGGFYAVYGDLFRRLNELEQSRCSKNHSDHPVFDFGDDAIEESDLRRFYNHWENFVSCMNFSWADKYMPNEAPNRAYRRAMDAENKKARDKARKEWQDSVQALARHVRKRDRRMMRFESQRQEQLRQRKEEEAARKAREKAERKQALEEQRERWRQQAEEFEEERKGAFLLADEDEKEAAYLYGDDEDDEEEDYVPAGRAAADAGEDEEGEDDDEEEAAGETQVFNCEICEKTFEKEEQYNQHINSRAHRAKKSELEKKAKKAKSQKPKPQQDETDAAGAAVTAEKPLETDDEVAAMTELSLSAERPTNRKPKKAAGAAAAAAAAAAPAPSGAAGAASCRVCGESFSSRSKMFQHLEASGHATAIPVPVAVAAIPEASRKGKKGKKK